MIPPAVRPAALRLPAQVPVPVLTGSVQPRSSKTFSHVAGAVKGAVIDYQDLNACAWFLGGGWELRNGSRLRRQRRGLSGGEDSADVRR